MAIQNVQTTIVVNFQTSDSLGGSLSAEIDDRDTGFNNGKTSFIPGDTAYFLVFKSDNVELDGVFASAGSIASYGTTTVEREEDVTFAGENTSSLQVPAQAITSYTWLGTSLGTLTLVGGSGSTEVKASNTCDTLGSCVGIARIKYTATALVYALASPVTLAGATSFPIVVLVAGHATT